MLVTWYLAGCSVHLNTRPSAGNSEEEVLPDELLATVWVGERKVFGKVGKRRLLEYWQ